MKLKEFELDDGNHFIGMEYHKIILNRTFLVLITEKELIGLKVNGLISVEGGRDYLTRRITKRLAITNNLESPYSYINGKYTKIMTDLDIYEEEIMAINSSNFRISLNELESVEYDDSKKWGMGNYPHDGKLYIKSNSEKKREFIILGAQSGEEITKWILDNKNHLKK